jgi:hypothetical protein
MTEYKPRKSPQSAGKKKLLTSNPQSLEYRFILCMITDSQIII